MKIIDDLLATLDYNATAIDVRQGPCGMGPMTGGGRGYCAVPLIIPETELDSLKNQAHALKIQLEQIEAKIENLRSTESKSTVRSK
ncbi:MAG: DUF5320 domain-containing protein [Desulfobacteraceae bacterium]|nr:DUF5320 domain-containing protein [Desulfobacteraceae bacterium]